MSRPFPDTFEKEQSPSTPASATSSTNPISYKANVNRAKTKKWADAKPASYGGDDWGDDDDYDLPPAPVSKPTGFRQQGQAIQSGQTQSPMVGNKKNYGDLPPVPSETSRARVNSFDADDEKRNFSSGPVLQSIPAPLIPPGPATRFSQITGQPSSRLASGPPALSISTHVTAPSTLAGVHKAVALSPDSQSSRGDDLGPGRTNSTDTSSVVSPISDSRTPSVDYQARRDYSPSAIVPPLHTRASPAPQSATDSPAAKLAPRKSSLSQSIRPDTAENMRSPQEGSGHKVLAAVRSSSPNSSTRSAVVQEGSAARPWVDAGGRSSSPSSTARSPTTHGKALPFIRPADIYKRMEEEMERQRQSLDSSTPSMESIPAAKSDERSGSPAANQFREPSSSDSSWNSGKQRTSMEGDETSETGRLKPMLASVTERKSEYGVEGFNINDQALQAAGVGTHMSDRDALQVENDRRSSTSPKLPDLNRISGFGIDIFAKPKRQEVETPPAHDKEALPTVTSHASNPTVTGPALRNQPSLGFGSLVSQAFDRRDDSSMPDTPISGSNSEFRRTDSESTGTAGISPIMSRVPSSAAQNREISIPSILEVVEEAKTTHQNDAESTPPRPRDGHDDITPTADNSTTTASNIPKPTTYPFNEASVVPATSSFSSLAGDEDQLQPPRPIGAREQSFRPNLPGGWTSYATSATQSETSHTDAPETQEPSIHPQTSSTEPTPTSQHDHEDELDLTPTTTKHPLPQSAWGSAALGAAALTGATDGLLASKNKESPVGTPRTGTPVIDEPPSSTRNDTLPSSDHITAPGTGLHTMENVGPEIQSHLERAPLATQLRPDTVNRAISAASSKAPTPPEKDIAQAPQEDYPDYLKPIVPLEQRILVEVEAEAEADERLQPLARPQALPTLSTDVREQEEENDKLRKEIINSLSPKPSDATLHNDAILPASPDDHSPSNLARISSYLPSEYDNYWATSNEEEIPVPASAGGPSREESKPLIQAESPHGISTTSAPQMEPESPTIQPLSPHNPGQPLDRPLMHEQRFSWQASATNESIAPDREREQHEAYNPSSRNQSTARQSEIDVEPKSVSGETLPQARQDPLRSHPMNDEPDVVRDAAVLAGGDAVGGATAFHANSSQPQQKLSRNLSLAEEKDLAISSSFPVLPSPPEDQHPARLSGTHLPPNTNHVTDPSVSSAPPNSVSAVHSPVQPQFSHQVHQTSKVPAFREIVAMRSPQQRIQTFNETRHKFATQDTGLANWMTTMKAQYEEHADASASLRGPRVSNLANTSARGKFGKSSAGAPPPIQQPYYQQYLNASSPTTPGTPATRPGPSTPVGSQQGLSPAGTKITTQQVQAKGKEFLHTAGVFGGKAGKVGKGLLAKSKNKLRGAGGGDKNAASPPASSIKSDRRTSWGNALTLSRSSGRPDNASRNSKDSRDSKESIRTIQRQLRQRAATLKLDTNQTPAMSQMTSATDDFYGIVSAPGILDEFTMAGALPAINQSPIAESPLKQSQKAAAVSHGIENKAADSQLTVGGDSINVPEPIGKDQPSWDPYNATPIAAAEGFRWEEPTKHQPDTKRAVHEPEITTTTTESANSVDQARRQPQPIPQAKDTGALAVPTKFAARSERTNGGDASFNNPPEHLSDLSDWVIVPKAVEQQVEAEPVNAPSNPVIEPKTQPQNPPPSVVVQLLESPQPAKNLSATTLSVLNRPQGDTGTSILDRPRYSYDVPREVRRTSLDTKTPPMQPNVPWDKSRPPQTHTDDYFMRPQPKAILQEHIPPPVLTNFTPPTQPKPGVEQYEPPPGPPPSHPSFHAVKELEKEDEPASATSFKGLPPIRRTSTFGLGFSSRAAKKRSVIEDEEGIPPMPQHQQDVDAASGSQQNISTPQSRLLNQQSQMPPAISSFPERPGTDHNGSTEQSQRTITQTQQSQSQQSFNAPWAAGFPPPVENIRRSQDSWRPNAISSASGLPSSRLSYEQQSRISVEQQRARTPSITQRPEVLTKDHLGKTTASQPVRPFEVPPSSAERYPDLFRQEHAGEDDAQEGSDLPAQYYQPPIPREAAFLPRQQTNEYQIPGVGPPANEPRPNPRRNSGIFKELGNKVRSASRERRSSVSRDGAVRASPVYGQGSEYAPSSIASEDTQDQKRRNGFFGINRASTSGMGPPQDRESMVAHNPGSRVDLLLSTQTSPIASPHDKKRSFFGGMPSTEKPKSNKLTRASTSGPGDDGPGKKKRFSGLSSMFGGRPSKEAPSSRGSVASDRPQATKELSHYERQTFESPMPDQSKWIRQPATQTLAPPQNQQAPQQRSFLAKATIGTDSRPDSKIRISAPTAGFLNRLSSGGISSQASQDRAREASNTGKTSSAGLLSGLKGRRSDKQDKSDSSSQGTRSQGSQPQYHPNQVPHARTYSDLQEEDMSYNQPIQHAPASRKEQKQAKQNIPQPVQQHVAQQHVAQQHVAQQHVAQQMDSQAAERGRRSSREPRYDNVPIPGGYSLVRGQGNLPVATDYDPRGYNHPQQLAPLPAQDSRVAQKFAPLPGGPIRSDAQQSTSSPKPVDDRYASGDRPLYNRPPNLGAVQTFDDYQRATARRTSREDLLARSPARDPDGQQRPYQLSLPENDSDREAHPITFSKDVPIISPPSSIRSPISIQTSPKTLPQDNSIQRLGQPTLRHPQSPAGYPLPDDTVYSPIDPRANQLPPPLPPQWPTHLDSTDSQHLHLAATDLDRSSTFRTAASGISQISNISGGNQVQSQRLAPMDQEMAGRQITPSPTPPSPGITPPPRSQKQGRGRGARLDAIQTTLANQRGPSPDLYTASPKVPPPQQKEVDNQFQRQGHPQVQRRRETNPQEEKIVYDADRLGAPEEDEEPGPAAMSATSYPGQEWNPYAGVYEDEF